MSYSTSTTFIFWYYKNNYLPTTQWRFNFMTWYSLRFASKNNSANLLSYQELHSQHDCAESCKLFHNLGKTKLFRFITVARGVLPIMTYTGRLRLNQASGKWKGRRLLVELYKRIGKSVIKRGILLLLKKSKKTFWFSDIRYSYFEDIAFTAVQGR